MSRVQLALDVSDFETAVGSYPKLVASSPAKVRPGYASFAISDPLLKLVFIKTSEGGNEHVSASNDSPQVIHLGT